MDPEEVLATCLFDPVQSGFNLPLAAVAEIMIVEVAVSRKALQPFKRSVIYDNDQDNPIVEKKCARTNLPRNGVKINFDIQINVHLL